jgi:hypothetical protein
MNNYTILIADQSHVHYAEGVSKLIEDASKNRAAGLAKRTPEYIQSKIIEGKAIIAINAKDEVIGFCYIESWGHEKFVANSGLIVSHEYTGKGIAKQIKAKAFELSRTKFPHAKLFGLTTNLAVMKINSSLGYKPVTFTELTDDNDFWKGCESCSNYDILLRTKRVHCLCTAMLYDSIVEEKKDSVPSNLSRVYDLWLKFKRNFLLKSFKVKMKV